MKQFSSTEKRSQYYANLYVNEVIKKYNPKFKIRYKRESKLLKIIGPIILLFNKNFFTDYVTVLFGTMWIPDDFYKSSHKSILKVVAHEGVHAYDRQKLPKFVFELLYLFPQILFIPFLFLAIFCSWWFLIPAFISLAPLPAPGRFILEMRGYATEKIWQEYVYPQRFYNPQEFVVYQLSSMAYYATWPFKKSVRKRFQKPVNSNDKVYKDVIDFIKRHNIKD